MYSAVKHEGEPLHRSRGAAATSSASRARCASSRSTLRGLPAAARRRRGRLLGAAPTCACSPRISARELGCGGAPRAPAPRPERAVPRGAGRRARGAGRGGPSAARRERCSLPPPRCSECPSVTLGAAQIRRVSHGGEVPDPPSVGPPPHPGTPRRGRGRRGSARRADGGARPTAASTRSASSAPLLPRGESVKSSFAPGGAVRSTAGKRHPKGSSLDHDPAAARARLAVSQRTNATPARPRFRSPSCRSASESSPSTSRRTSRITIPAAG